MSYMGLFWETGMPEAWALSRRSGDKPEANPADGSRLDLNTMSLLWSQAMVDEGERPVIPYPTDVVPGDNAGRPVPKPDGEKTKKG